MTESTTFYNAIKCALKYIKVMGLDKSANTQVTANKACFIQCVCGLRFTAILPNLGQMPSDKCHILIGQQKLAGLREHVGCQRLAVEQRTFNFLFSVQRGYCALLY